jgi:oxygen-independent coproporphyrinogen-3 oxidase
MAGIYIHIPFCKKACHYCDFHFITSLQYKSEMIEALIHELVLQKNYLEGQKVETIYFGGGTPSLLEADELTRILDALSAQFNLATDLEITLEANPDDLTIQKVKNFKQTPINRFSIGVQSFFDEDLMWMNRSHSASEAESAIKRVQDAGFENITADLIYGYPLLSDEKWSTNIRQMLELHIPHISCYSMTIEPGTALAHFTKQGKSKPINERQSAAQFIELMDKLQEAGFLHYEISNFAQSGYESKHNTNYWKGEFYLGIGPSAHSFNGVSRQWNIANNANYLAAIAKHQVPAQVEVLTLNNRFNEYLMTSLRTHWGADMHYVRSNFGTEYANLVLAKAETMLQKNWIKVEDEILVLTEEGKLFADHIAAEFFIIDHD